MSGTQTNTNQARAATDVPSVSVAVSVEDFNAAGDNQPGTETQEANDFLDVGGGATPMTSSDTDDDDVDLSLLEGDGQPGQDEQEEIEEGFLEIDSEKCLTCKSLIPFMTKTYKSCHFTAGNKNCPAASTKIIVKIPLDTIVPKFLAAERGGDFARLAKLSAVLSEKPDWYQQRVKDALDQERSNSN